MGLGFRALGFGFRALGFGFRVEGLGFRVLRDQELGFRFYEESGFTVQSSRVHFWGNVDCE